MVCLLILYNATAAADEVAVCWKRKLSLAGNRHLMFDANSKHPADTTHFKTLMALTKNLLSGCHILCSYSPIKSRAC
jgi:hypothetical protein